MSKRAEDAALKAYPYEGNDHRGTVSGAFRAVYARGYEQAEKDTIERAIAWLKEHADDYIVDLTPTYPDAPVNIVVGGKCWDDLKEYLEEEK